MHEEREEKRLRVHTKRKKLGLGWKLEERKVFGEKVRFGSREIEIFDFAQSRVGPQIYIYIYIYKRSLIDWEVSRRYRWQKDLNRLRRYRVSIEQIETPKNWLDGSSYLLRDIENKPRNLNRRGMYWGAIEQVSSCYREVWKGFFEEKQHKMNANKIDTNTSN